MFCLQQSKNMTLPVESIRQSHNNIDSVSVRFPFAIQHLLGIDATHQRHPHDVTTFTHHQQQSPLSSDVTTVSQPMKTDNVTYSAWTCPPSDVTPTTWYRDADAMILDDVIGSANIRRQSSLPTLTSHRRLAAAASLTCLPSPISSLPALTDNASGIHYHTHKPPVKACVCVRTSLFHLTVICSVSWPKIKATQFLNMKTRISLNLIILV